MKYDWIRLKHDYVSGNWLSKSEFFRYKQIKNNSKNRSKTVGWKEERKLFLQKALTQTQEKLIESEANIRLRQQKAAKFIQYKGLEQLKNLNPKTIEEARKLVVSGLQEERAAIGLNQVKNTGYIENDHQSLLGDRWAQISYVELLELIADVKREKERRVITKYQEGDKKVSIL